MVGAGGDATMARWTQLSLTSWSQERQTLSKVISYVFNDVRTETKVMRRSKGVKGGGFQAEEQCVPRP